MTLEEAIKHAEEVGCTCENNKCGADHKQLAKWLKELQEYRNNSNAIKQKTRPFDVERQRNMSIEEVIEDFKGYEVDDSLKLTFTDGYCYDFAYMLQRLFGGDIVYNMIDHYLLHVNGKFYDITGEVPEPDEFVVENC